MDLYRYIDFYLDLVATPDNISLLYHLAMKAKTVRDAESHTFSEVSGISTGCTPLNPYFPEPLCHE